MAIREFCEYTIIVAQFGIKIIIHPLTVPRSGEGRSDAQVAIHDAAQLSLASTLWLPGRVLLSSSTSGLLLRGIPTARR